MGDKTTSTTVGEKANEGKEGGEKSKLADKLSNALYNNCLLFIVFTA